MTARKIAGTNRVLSGGLGADTWYTFKPSKRLIAATYSDINLAERGRSK